VSLSCPVVWGRNPTRYARKVFLEDAVELQHRYPNFPAYRHPVFLMPEWAQYASRERVNTEVRKKQYTSSAADIQAQLQAAADAHTEALQGLHSKLDAVISGPPQAPPAPPTAAAAPVAEADPRVSILPLTIEDITQFYWVWCTELRAQYRARKRLQWKDFDKHTARLASQRWAQLSILVDFLDGIQTSGAVSSGSGSGSPVGPKAAGSGVEAVGRSGSDSSGSGSGSGSGSEPSKAALDALGVMVSFADTSGVSHTVLAKKVVGEMIKALEVGPVYKGMGAQLRAELEAAGFIVPVCTKQDHSYKKKNV
jgi:hypothetical protein